MKLALLNDLPVAGALSSGLGSGAELTSGRFAREGTKRGHTVDIITPEYANEATFREYDLLVAKNVTAFPESTLRAIMDGKTPYVTWPSDYAWTRWRLFFAFQEPHKRLTKTMFFKEWFTKSRLNVFLSPLHQDAYHWVMPELDLGQPEFISPPPIHDLFLEDAKTARDRLGLDINPNTAVTVNGGLEFKALHSSLDWAYSHPDWQFTFIGSIRENVNLPPNAKFAGRLSWTDLHAALLQAEAYVELPKTIQPYNNSCAQGFLASQRVITNENMGVASYPWFRAGDTKAARHELAHALPDLWARLEKEVPA